ncbi:MAG: cellulose 1,4-beta-cellobiosidase, partial [Ruminococcus sp.]|nr:cellulose 1,4-beta-cellobiosidase [Ruminococcus sp.]
MWGDANVDEKVNISDAVLIMQSIANPEEFTVSAQGKLNGDVIDNGGGLTNLDALAIQYVEIKTITNEAFPMSANDLDALNS